MTPSSSLDLIRDEVPRLQRVRHARRPHADTIAANMHLSTWPGAHKRVHLGDVPDTDSAKLISDNPSINYRFLYMLTEAKQMLVASKGN